MANDKGKKVDTDSDRYPTLDKVLSAIQQQVSTEVTVVERFELTALANGEANYRVWPPRADEPIGGFLPEGF